MPEGQEQQQGQVSPLDDLEKALREGDLWRALQLLDGLIALYPDRPELVILILQCYISLGRPVSALMATRRFKADYAGNPELLELMRVIYHQLLLDGRAMQIARLLIKTGAASEGTHEYFVRSLIEAGHAAEAADAVVEGLEKYPDSDRLKHVKGLVHLQFGEKDAASAISEELTSQGSPLGAELLSLTNKGRSQPDSQLSSEAAEKVRECLKEATDHLAKGDPEAAARALITAIRTDSSPALAYTRLGFVYDYCGLHDESSDLHKKAIEKDPALIEAYRNLAYAFYKKGDFKQVVDTYAKALEVDPSNVEMHNGIGLVYDYLGKHNKAIKHFQEALKSDPSSEAAWRNLGLSYEAQGKVEEATNAYERAIRINPDSQANVNVATLYRTLHRYRKAKKILRDIIGKDPEPLTPWLELALCHKGLNENKKFAEVFGKAKDMPAKNPAEAFTKAQLMELLDERIAYDCWNTYLAMAEDAPQEVRRTKHAKDRVGALSSKLGLTPPSAHVTEEEPESEEGPHP